MSIGDILMLKLVNYRKGKQRMINEKVVGEFKRNCIFH